MRLSLEPPISVAEGKRIGELLLADAQVFKKQLARNCTFRIRFKELHDGFFENDVPIFEDQTSKKMCWRTSIFDASGELEVKVWDHACYELFGVTASGLCEKWEEGNVDQAQRGTILLHLNSKMEYTFDCMSSISVWSPFSHTALRVQVSVNSVEAVQA